MNIINRKIENRRVINLTHKTAFFLCKNKENTASKTLPPSRGNTGKILKTQHIKFTKQKTDK